MTQWTSLFAEKLRAHRAAQGKHGRMTQEQLAEALGVSVEAISKYERSLSYIRGDLEARLTDRLGWRFEEVRACREDWDASRAPQQTARYRLLCDQDVVTAFGGSNVGVTAALAGMEADTGEAAPPGFSAGDRVWDDLGAAGHVYGPYVLQGDTLVGHVGLIYPDAGMEAAFRDGLFEEGDLAPDRVKRPILPGSYFAYCSAIYVARGHEACGRLLLSGFVSGLEALAERDITLSEIGAIAVNPQGRQLCEDLGLHFQGHHKRHAGLGLWSLPGRDIPTSLLGRRSATLRRAYGPRDEP